MRHSAVELAKKLISFHSVTPNQAGSIDFIQELLNENGFKTYRYEFGPEEGRVTNLYAVKGETGPNLCFAGHVDVVPTGDLNEWASFPFNPVEVEGTLFGRGTVDMKGAIAASLAAALNYDINHKYNKSKISFLITSDEEGPGTFGTKELLKKIHEDGHKIDFAIVGEPTCDEVMGDIIKIGRRGSINFTLKILGEQGHVAYPEKANNPHPYLVKILHKFTHLSLDKGNEFFDPSSLQITSIDTNNPTRNIIPLSCTVLFNIRYNTEHSRDSLVDLIKSIIESITPNYQLEYGCSANPFIGSVNNFKKEFANIVEQVTGITPKFSTTGGTSDARFIKDYADFLEFGLLNSTAHKIDECCKISDLQMLYNVYYMAIEKFNNGNALEQNEFLKDLSGEIANQS
jgi:succinyl-diaminopimelate desuccinylase